MYSDEVFEMGMDRNGEWSYNTYYAARDGSLKQNTWVKKTGIWYYFGADGAGYEGIQTIKGENYYFKSGKMIEGTFKNVDGTLYLIQKDGTLNKVKNNTWTKAWGDWYYAADGEILKDCVKKIGNAYYGFDDYGRMYEDKMFDLMEWIEEGEHRGEEIHHVYFAKADGTLLTANWLKKADEWYYFGENGEGFEGIQTIRGIKYYFEAAKMQTGGTVEADGITYEICSDGTLKVKETEDAQKDGWLQKGKNWYYVKDHAFYTDTIEKINGKLYGFDADGRMYENVSFQCRNADGILGTYYADKSGALRTSQKYQSGKDTYYFDEYGRGYEGAHMIDGKPYQFEGGKIVG